MKIDKYLIEEIKIGKVMRFALLKEEKGRCHGRAWKKVPMKWFLTRKEAQEYLDSILKI